LFTIKELNAINIVSIFLLVLKNAQKALTKSKKFWENWEILQQQPD